MRKLGFILAVLAIMAFVAVITWLDWHIYFRTHVNATWWTWLLSH